MTSANSASFLENGTGVVYQATATDPDGDSISITIGGGADADQFELNYATDTLRFISPPDYEQPADADGDNVYEIVFEASDASAVDTLAVSITVTDEPNKEIVPLTDDGFSAVGADDVNGDGRRDFLIFHVYSGNFISGAEISAIEDDFAYRPQTALGGFAVAPTSAGVVSDAAPVGDLNGDGVTEFLFGLPYLDRVVGPRTIASDGEALVLDGAALAANAGFEPTDLDSASIEIAGISGVGGVMDAGQTIAVLPDLDGDGRAELLIGAPHADGGNIAIPDFGSRGDVYVVYSTTYDADSDGVLYLDFWGAAYGPVITADEISFLTGSALASVGDVDNDDIPDFAVGAEKAYAPDSERGGFVGVMSGADVASAGVATIYINTPRPGTTQIISKNPNRVIGKHVAAAGDVDGDGLDDVLIGAPLADQSGAANAGEVILVYGSAIAANAGGELDLETLTPDQGVRILGHVGNGWLGYALSPLGDLNSDGRDEFLIGAPTTYDPDIQITGWEPSGAGAVYVVDGAALSGLASGVLDLADLASMSPAPAIEIPGLNDLHGVGIFADSVGDIDADGLPDVMIGAWSQTEAPPSYYIAGSRLAEAMRTGEASIALPLPPARP